MPDRSHQTHLRLAVIAILLAAGLLPLTMSAWADIAPPENPPGRDLNRVPASILQTPAPPDIERGSGERPLVITLLGVAFLLIAGLCSILFIVIIVAIVMGVNKRPVV